MRFRSIRIRLTAWYLAMLVLGLGVFGVGSWYAMRASVFHTLDEELEDRIRGVEKFMQIQIASLSPIEIRERVPGTLRARPRRRSVPGLQ